MQRFHSGAAAAVAVLAAIAAFPVLVAPQAVPPEREFDLAVRVADATLLGSPNKDQLGNDLDLGDVNDDGRDDIVVGAQWSSGGGRNIVGRSYVVFGRSEWPPVVDMASGGADWSFYGAGREARLGSSVVAADWDHDGTLDPVLGSLLADQLGQHNGGAVYLVRGGPWADASVDFLYDAPDGLLVGDSRTSESDQLGTGMTVGDFNGDGTDDLAVAAAFRLQETGAVFVWFGPIAPGTVHNLRSQSADWTILGPAPNSWFGSNLAAADVTGDAVDDLIVSALGVAPGAAIGVGRDVSDSGAVYVFAGNSDVGGEIDLAVSSATTTIVGRASTRLGVALAVGTCGCRGQPLAAADFTGDGSADLVIGSPMEARFRGSVSVLRGPIAPGTLDLALVEHGRITGAAAGDRFGWSVVGGALDGDGLVDLVIASPWAPSGERSNAGRLDGLRGALEASGDRSISDSAVALVVRGPEPGAGNAGGTVALGDVNADGTADLIWGLPDAAPMGRRSAGAVYLWLGPILATLATTTSEPTATATVEPSATPSRTPELAPSATATETAVAVPSPSDPPPTASFTDVPSPPTATGAPGASVWLPMVVRAR